MTLTGLFWKIFLFEHSVRPFLFNFRFIFTVVVAGTQVEDK